MAALLNIPGVFLIFIALSNMVNGQFFFPTHHKRTESSSLSHDVPEVVHTVLRALGLDWNHECARAMWNTMKEDCNRRWAPPLCYSEYSWEVHKIAKIYNAYVHCTFKSRRNGQHTVREETPTENTKTTTPKNEESATDKKDPLTMEDIKNAFRSFIDGINKEEGENLSEPCYNNVYETFLGMCKEEDTTCLQAALNNDKKKEQLTKEAVACLKDDTDRNLIKQLNTVLTTTMPDDCEKEALATAKKLCSQEKKEIPCEKGIMEDYQKRQRVVNDSAICYFNHQVKDSPFSPLKVNPTYDDVDIAIQKFSKDVESKMHTGSPGIMSGAIIDYLANWCPINRRLLYHCESRMLADTSKLTELGLAGWLASVHENNERNGPPGPTTEITPVTTQGSPIQDDVPQYKTLSEVFDYLRSKLGTDITPGCSQQATDAIDGECPDAASRATCEEDAVQNNLPKLIEPTATCYYQNALASKPLTPFDMDYTGATIEDGVEDGSISLTEQMAARLGIPYTEDFEDSTWDALYTKCSDSNCAFDTLENLTSAAEVGQTSWIKYITAIVRGSQQ